MTNPEKTDKFAVTECSKCGIVVHYDRIRYEKDYPDNPIHDGHRGFLAFQPKLYFIDTEPCRGVCKCKFLSTTELRWYCDTANIELDSIRKRIKWIRSMCRHEEWWLTNFGDYRYHTLRKNCTICGQMLESPTDDEVRDFLSAHPGYSYDGYSVQYLNSSEPPPKTIFINGLDEN